VYQLKSLVLLFFLANILGCQSIQKSAIEDHPTVEPFPELDNSPFEFQTVPTANQIFTLSDSQKEDFFNYYYADENSQITEHKRLLNYLNNKLNQFNFLGKTFTAKQTLAEDAGNCLSLAILTTALADAVGLEIQYQKVNSAPIYHRHNNIMKTSGHVRTIVYEKETEQEEDVIVLRRRSVIVDYFPSVNNVGAEFVSEEDFISMFYQNLAGDALVSGEFDEAFSYLQEALKLNQYNPYTLNTLAVLNNQIKHTQNTEKLFEFAVKNTERTVNLVSNYANYLEKHGQTDKAAQLLADIDANNDRNPYDWLDTANQYLKVGDYRLALKYFEKAKELGPYLHEVHFGLAQVYAHHGRTFEAIKALEKANSLTYEDPTKRLYTAKVMTLTESSD
jgi:tetratricopeptide (TPR) repeat protein